MSLSILLLYSSPVQETPGSACRIPVRGAGPSGFYQRFFLFGGFVDVIVIMDIDPAGFFQSFFLVRTVLGVLPLGFNGAAVEFIGLKIRNLLSL